MFADSPGAEFSRRFRELGAIWCYPDEDIDYALNRLVTSYAFRPYHGLAHINQMLTDLDDYQVLSSEPLDPTELRILQLAIWWHDVVYEAGSSDNELLSAFDLMRWLGRPDFQGLGLYKAGMLILSSKEHQDTYRLGRIAQIFFDLDFAVFAFSPEGFATAEENIRREYAYLSDETWAKGRADFLTKMLLRGRIYSTNYFHDKWELEARLNIHMRVEYWKTQS